MFISLGAGGRDRHGILSLGGDRGSGEGPTDGKISTIRESSFFYVLLAAGLSAAAWVISSNSAVTVGDLVACYGLIFFFTPVVKKITFCVE